MLKIEDSTWGDRKVPGHILNIYDPDDYYMKFHIGAEEDINLSAPLRIHNIRPNEEAVGVGITVEMAQAIITVLQHYADYGTVLKTEELRALLS